MDDEKLKTLLGKNIAAHRKRCGLTQAQLAALYDITVDDLIRDPNELPPDADGKMQQVVEKTLKRKANKSIILWLSALLVWFVALFIYVVVSSFDIANSWLPFFYAIPITAIVLLSLRSAWHDFRWNRVYISVIVWGALLCFHVTFWVFFHVNVWRVFLLGIPGQIAILLWFRMFHHPKDKEEESHE